MLEKINLKYYEKLSVPNEIVVNLVKKLVEANPSISVAEIGVGIGATSEVVYQAMRDVDSYYLFDYDDVVHELADDLTKKYFNGPVLLREGNTRKLFDSYAWSLKKLALSEKKFDLIFLDGAHNFLFDSVVCSLADLLINHQGYFIIDDINITINDIIAHNPSKKQYFEQRYSTEQMQTSQLRDAIALYLETSSSFAEIEQEDHNIKVYQKYR